MTSLIESIEKLNTNLERQSLDKERRKGFSIPWRVRRGAAKVDKVIVVFLGSNRRAQFKLGEIVDGLIKVEGKFYGHEQVAVYHYSKKFTLVVIFEWRLLPAGGLAEEYRSRLLGGEEDIKLAQELKVSSFGSLAIVRAVEQAIVSEDAKKKKFGGIIWWVLGGVAALYMISRAFDGGA